MIMQMPLAFLVGVPGGGELLLIFVAVLLMFGPKKLPEIARNIGKAMEYLRQTSQEFRDQIMRLDEEATKTIEAAVVDKSDTGTQTAQNELPLGVSESPPSEDPYPNTEDYPGIDSSMPAPDGEEKSAVNNEVKLEENNAAKIDSNITGIQEGIAGPEVEDAGKGNGFAD